jgi:DnaJ like chaperone protein
MAKFGKLIGSGLGWAVLGPIGAIVGFIIGSVIDSADQGVRTQQGHQFERGRRTQTTRGDYMVSLLILVAATMKADGKILRSELDYVKNSLNRNFGLQSANEAISMLKNILKQDIPVADVCLQIKNYMDYSSRLQLMHFLFGITAADGEVHVKEQEVVNNIARNLGISNADYISIESMFVKNTDGAYKILEIDSEATDEQIKKAYRKMALKYHPDKVSYLGYDVQLAAKEKFQKVNEAYSTICNQRGIT